MRLLLVEDEPHTREIVAELLEDAGYATDGAGSVAEAIAALRARAYNLVILDLGLPDGDGSRVLGHLRARGSAMPVLVCTGFGQDDTATGLLESGADAVIEKPFSGRELLARVRALLRRTAPAHRLQAGGVALVAG
jgi:DNA-binding response OmpR family regulator